MSQYQRSAWYGIFALPRFDKVCEGKYGTKENAETAHNHVGNPQEWVLATHNGASGDEDRLGSAVLIGRKAWMVRLVMIQHESGLYTYDP